MSIYRFLEDAFIGGLYYQAGTTASTADVGGTLPINWVPNGNIDPVDTAAFNAMQAAGPQPQGLITTQFSALPVAPPNTRWVQNPVTGQFTLVQGLPPYVMRPLFFNGKTWLISFGTLGTLNIPKVTFAGWFNSTNWDTTSTVWVTDPGGNNSPFLKIISNSFSLGTKGQQLGSADYYTSQNGITWSANIGGLSVSGASFGDGNSGLIAGFQNSFVISYGGTGFFAPATHKIQLLISTDGGKTFSVSPMIGYTSGSNSALVNYYDAHPVSGFKQGFRLALTNQAQTQTTYMSSYDGAVTWVNEGTSQPTFWGQVQIQSYAKGTFNGQPFYVAAVGGNIYGGTTQPTPPINSVPAGWSLLFSPSMGGGNPHMAVNTPGQSNTRFVVNASGNALPIIVTGTGDPTTWQEIALSGSLAITSGSSNDPSTWVYINPVVSV